MNMVVLVLLSLILDVHLFSQESQSSCSLGEGKYSVCGVEGGTYDENEFNAITHNDAEPFKEKIHRQPVNGKIYLYLFYAFDCPHCKKAHKVLDELKVRYPELVVQQYEIKRNSRNRDYFEKTLSDYGMKPQGIPTIFIGDKVHVGFFENVTCNFIINEINRLKGMDTNCNKYIFEIPIIGTINVGTISLPAFTIYIGLLDGLNPCAMWVLTFLLGLMVYSRDRRKILFLGTTFVVASGVVYFIFMAAWLNLFLVIGYSKPATIILGLVAVIMGIINIKELFFFKQGVSLMIPEFAKPKLYKKARDLIHEKNKVFMIIGTVALAVFVNFIELGCTIGLPAIYTRILSVKALPAYQEYLYMGLYNVAYVVPLAIIVGLFAFTMGHYKIAEKHAKILKVVSGLLMLVLGVLLLIAPEMLIFK